MPNMQEGGRKPGEFENLFEAPFQGKWVICPTAPLAKTGVVPKPPVKCLLCR